MMNHENEGIEIALDDNPYMFWATIFFTFGIIMIVLSLVFSSGALFTFLAFISGVMSATAYQMSIGDEYEN